MANLKALYRLKLDQEYQNRVGGNSRFSKNSFAKFLGLTPSYYSKMTNGKIILSLELGEQIVTKLNLSPKDREIFLHSIAEEQKCHSLYQIDPSLTTCNPDDKETNELPKKR